MEKHWSKACFSNWQNLWHCLRSHSCVCMHVLDEDEKGLGCQTGDSISHASSRLGLHWSDFQLKLPNRLYMKKGFHCLKKRGWDWEKNWVTYPQPFSHILLRNFDFIFLTMRNSLKGFKQGKALIRLLNSRITSWLKRGRVEADTPPWGLVSSNVYWAPTRCCEDLRKQGPGLSYSLLCLQYTPQHWMLRR